ncbi:MAG: hypothetical protein V3W41_01570 [Planctomycetota bacterium]
MDEANSKLSKAPWLRWLFVVICVCALTKPIFDHLDDSYVPNSHGHLAAIFGMMAATSVESGIVETRFLPAITPNPARHPNLRYYVTHPVLDHVIRTFVTYLFDASELTCRLQGFGGLILFSVFLFLLAKRTFGFAGSMTTLAASLGLQMSSDITLISMYVPMTIATSMIGLWLFAKYRDNRDWLPYWGMMAFFSMSMQMDWPGYFLPGLLWLGTLRRPTSRGFDLRLTLGLAGLALGNLALFFAHIQFCAGLPGGFMSAIRHASDTGRGSLYSAGNLRAFWGHQVNGYGVGGLAIVIAAAFLVALAPNAKKWRVPFILLFGWGLANIVAFPAKTANHTFWSAYWIPLVAASYGLCFEVLSQQLNRKLKIRSGLWLAVVAVLGFGIVNCTRDYNDAGVRFGDSHRYFAEQLKLAVPKKDRWVFVTNFREVDAIILANYVRTNVVVRKSLAPGDLESILRPAIAKHLWHVRGKRVLFFLADPVAGQPDTVATRESLRTELLEYGAPYGDIPNVFDITRWIWSKGIKSK